MFGLISACWAAWSLKCEGGGRGYLVLGRVLGREFGLLELEPESLEDWGLTADLGRVEGLELSWLRLQCGVLGALLSVGLTGGQGGQSLPELGLTSLLPEENQDSRQDSQFEYFWLLESHFFTLPGLLSYHSTGGSGRMFSGGRGRLTEPGLRSKLTSFSWNDIEDSERLSGEAVLSSLEWEQVVWWWTITMARSISLPGLRDLLRDFDLLCWWEFTVLSQQPGPARLFLSLFALLLTVSSPAWCEGGTGAATFPPATWS